MKVLSSAFRLKYGEYHVGTESKTCESKQQPFGDIMKLVKTLPWLCLSSVMCLAALGSEEDVHQPYQISLRAATGKPFGDVSATITTNRKGRDTRVTSTILIVKGKKYFVPQTELRKLLRPQLNSATFLTGAARDGGSPWLYLKMRLATLQVTPQAKSTADYHKAYIPFRNGKLQPIQVWLAPS
jgi:hypothetical protein